jgi:hypothetical protein
MPQTPDELREYKKIYARLWRSKNRDYAKAKARERYQLHKERLSAYYKKYRDANRDKIRARERERYAADPSKALGKRRRLVYGVDHDDYVAMLAAQHGGCAICKSKKPKATGKGNARFFCVDHDHSTGAIRGLLCHRCNSAIGLMEDSPVRLREAAAYLLLHKSLWGSKSSLQQRLHRFGGVARLH